MIERTFVFLLGAVFGVASLIGGYWYYSTSAIGFQLQPVVKNTEQSPLAIAKPLVLPLEVDIEVAMAFVNTGFGQNPNHRFQSTSFLTPGLRSSQAQELISLVKEYNNFSGAKVAAGLAKFSGRVSSVEFGREGSPVLYIRLPHWTHQRELSTETRGTKISDDDSMKLVLEIREVFVGQLHADEFGVMPFDSRVVRIWWD